MALKLSAPKKDGQELSPDQVQAASARPFPIKFTLDAIEWEVWVDFRRVSPAIANAYIVAYSKGLLAGDQNEPLKREILQLAHQLKTFGQVAGAVETPKPAKGRGKSRVEVAPEPVLTLEEVEAVSEITEEIKHKSSRYTLAQIVATGDQQSDLYEAECAVVADAIVRLDEKGEVARHGTPALNYPDFDPTFENLLGTGLIGPEIVKAIMVEFHPTSAGSRPTTPKTDPASSTS